MRNMKKIIIILFLILLFTGNSLAATPCNDANNQGCFLMEDTGNESNQSVNSSDVLVETGGTIPRDTGDFKFGLSSRDFELGDIEDLQQADGLSTDIFGADQQLTVMAWIKLESVGTNMSVISKYRASGNQRQYALWVTSSQKANFFMSDSVADGEGVVEIVGDTTLSVDTWYHIAGVYDDVDLKVYINGISDATPVANTAGIFNGSEPFHVGQHGAGTNFDGLIDDVGIFDTAYTQSEIQAVIDYGLNGEAPPATIGVVLRDVTLRDITIIGK